MPVFGRPLMPEARRLLAAVGPVSGTVEVPGSKSIANRALIVAALAHGDSELERVPDGDDTTALVECLGALGVTAERLGDNGLIVAGNGGVLRPDGSVLHAGLAGTTSRFLTAVTALGAVPITVDGDPPLRARPMAELHGALASLGATIVHGEIPGRLPVTVTGPARGGTATLRGDVSSQFVTALMLVGPLLADGLTLQLSAPLVSRPYVEMTAAVMASFGAAAEVTDRTIIVPPGRYVGRRFTIEPDASSASYPLAIAAVRGGDVIVPALTRDSLQGDIAIVDLLTDMGCVITETTEGLTISRDPALPLLGIDVDMSDVSDLVPTIAAVAVTASTPTTIRGVGFIRAKESDRLGDLAAELRKTGASVDVTHDGLHIEPVSELHGAALATHHDHRLAMAFAVLASGVDGVIVEDPGVVSKSWPGFWNAYDTLLKNPEPD